MSAQKVKDNPPKAAKSKVANLFNSFVSRASNTSTSDSGHADVIFGAPLGDCMERAGSRALLVRQGAEMGVEIPIIVAECGQHLKREGCHVEGIFRVSGSSARIQRLQDAFSRPPSFGRDLDWSEYAVFDAADILRRYLAQLPEPVIPASFYSGFTNLAHVVHQQTNHRPFADHRDLIDVHQKLIDDLPLHNQNLLVYLLDLLSLFSANSDNTLMDASKLAVVFQPELLCDLTGKTTLSEHEICREALRYLIENGDKFATTNFCTRKRGAVEIAI